MFSVAARGAPWLPIICRPTKPRSSQSGVPSAKKSLRSLLRDPSGQPPAFP